MLASSRLPALVVLGGLAASAVALAVAPVLMPAGYSWLAQTTSESAAQGVPGAWLPRAGFVLFGLSVLLLAGLRCRAWGPAGTILHGAFGVMMMAAAVFSTRPWQAGAAYDRAEDTLHSVAATAVGFAFAIGVVAVAINARRLPGRRRWALDVTAVLASVLVPLAMAGMPDLAGGWQRLMFLVAYAWYALEGVAVLPGRADPPTS